MFGLGARAAADVVRVLWPAGIVQAEPLQPMRRHAEDAPHSTLALTELDRKPSSCPYLYTWNGERFEFVTDFMGGGEMGYQHAPGVAARRTRRSTCGFAAISCGPATAATSCA